MSADRLPVHLSRSELHAVEAPASFEATGSFDVELVNHGTSLHVHLNLDEALSSVAELDTVNHFVDGESRQLVRVQVFGDEELPVSGQLKVAAAHGAETRLVDVELTPPDFGADDPVAVDESLSEPPADADEGSGSSSPLVANPNLVVLVFGVLAVLAAGGIALVVDDTLVVGGAVVVLVGFLVAIYLLLSG